MMLFANLAPIEMKCVYVKLCNERTTVCLIKKEELESVQ